MEPVKNPVSDALYAGAPGSEVLALPAFHDDDGAVCSVWELDEQDLEAILQHGQIKLAVHQDPPPPVSMTVVGPWCDEHEHFKEWSPELQTWTCAVDDPD